jgi:hypothetical protein
MRKGAETSREAFTPSRLIGPPTGTPRMPSASTGSTSTRTVP